MQTDYLREFIDLCDTLSYTRSSRRLNVSQSSLSRHIMALEDEIGARLFDRSTDSVKLSQAGRSLYDEAREVVKNIDEMQANARRSAHMQVTTLKVSGSTIQPSLNRFLSRMQARASAESLPVRFEYTQVRPISGEQKPREATELLDTASADLLIEIYPPTSEQLSLHNSIWLFSEPLYALVSADNPLAKRKGLTLKDLSGKSFLLCSVYQHCTTLYEDALSRGGCTPGHIRTPIVDDLLLIPELLAHLGPDEINILQANFVASYGFGDDAMGGIKLLDLHDPEAALAFYLVWRKGDERPAVKMAVELAQKVRQSCQANPSPAADQFVPAVWNE
jgi:DNA-binding transcriptional LysR family regulator